MCELSTARWTCPPGVLTQEKSTQRQKQENRICSSNSSIQFPAQGGVWCPVLAGGEASSDWLCGKILSVVTLPPSSSFMLIFRARVSRKSCDLSNCFSWLLRPKLWLHHGPLCKAIPQSIRKLRMCLALLALPGPSCHRPSRDYCSSLLAFSLLSTLFPQSPVTTQRSCKIISQDPVTPLLKTILRLLILLKMKCKIPLRSL